MGPGRRAGTKDQAGENQLDKRREQGDPAFNGLGFYHAYLDHASEQLADSQPANRLGFQFERRGHQPSSQNRARADRQPSAHGQGEDAEGDQCEQQQRPGQ